MATFDALPATAAQLILKKLSCNNDDLASARLSCKSLRDASCTAITSATPRSNAALLDLCMKWAGLQNLDLRHVRHKVTEEQAACMQMLPCLQQLALRGNIVDKILSHLGETRRITLTHLDVRGVGDEVAAQIATLQQLRHVAIMGPLSDVGLVQLTTLQQLQHFSLTCCDVIGDEGLQELLPYLPLLQSVQLHSCLQLGSSTLHALAQLTQLTLLSLSHSCDDVSGDALLALSTLQHLKQLNLSAASENAAPAALAKLLAALTQLTQLDVSYCESVNPGVLRAIATALVELRVLGLSGVNARPLHCMHYLTNLGKLQQLELRWAWQLKNAQLSFLPHLVALTALDLGYCRNLTCDGLQVLQWMTQLKALGLMGLQPDDLSCLSALRQLTSLTVASLSGSSSAWQHLAGLTNLQALALRRCQLSGDPLPQPHAAAGSSSSNDRPSNSYLDKSLAPSLCNSRDSSIATPVDSFNKMVPHLAKLVALDCSGSNVTAKALSRLQLLPSLRHLGLSRCQNVVNTALAALQGCMALQRLDLRVRGAGSNWNLKGLMRLLKHVRGLHVVYVSELLVGLPRAEECRVLMCQGELVALPIACDAEYSMAMALKLSV